VNARAEVEHEEPMRKIDAFPLGPPGCVEATIAGLDAAGLPEADLAAVYAGSAQRLLDVR